MSPKCRAAYCLGTVQFGLRYGINNAGGQPDRSVVFAILDQALDAGIDCWDTAVAYGEAENVLGDYIRQRRCAGSVRIVSKLRPDFVDTIDKGVTIAAVRKELEDSLQRLGVETLEGYLLHRSSQLALPGMADALQDIRDRGLVRQVGVSVYEPDEAMAVLQTDWMDAVQVPYNILDRRLDRAGFFSGLSGRQRPLNIYARSALLQGLLLMKEDRTPEHLAGIKPYLRELDSMLGRYGLDRFSGAVQFVMEHNGVDHLVFGVETSEQLAEYLKLREKAWELRECWAACLQQFDDVEHKLLSPNLWESLKREEGTV